MSQRYELVTPEWQRGGPTPRRTMETDTEQRMLRLELINVEHTEKCGHELQAEEDFLTTESEKHDPLSPHTFELGAKVLNGSDLCGLCWPPLASNPPAVHPSSPAVKTGRKKENKK
ncbi:hypothetical protein JOB18_042776 [Solea senegalensis]|uniref:Uncharacterized protein n=1 Tax=Solea senegalensis TaxID=28829 RepID=A0AAV6S2X0_SOLSE|nr:hypothetical protein JOB18_042776 [Solea senegalensis]